MILGPPSELSNALLMGAGWVINLAVAEWAIRRHRHPVRPPVLADQPSDGPTRLVPRV